MNWTRGGTKQRAKVEEQYKFYAGNPGLALMKKLKWTVGKGLGDGKGRIGSPWGLKGHWLKNGTFKERLCNKLWGCPYPVEPAVRCGGAARFCYNLNFGCPCDCCTCTKVPRGADRISYIPHRSTIPTITITTTYHHC